MAGEENTEAGTENALCKRCHQSPITHQIRSERVCKACFSQYIMTKTVKRMETYRIRGPSTKARKFLLPLSFGPSSASLLYMLDQQIQRQFDRMRHAAYDLYVVHIDLYLDPEDQKDATELLEKYKARFPRHIYSRIGLEQALNLDGIDWKTLNIEPALETNAQRPIAERLQQLLGSMSSATSRADIASTLLTRLLVDIAKRNDCDSILFGDSTTRLAEKTLTATAKGRGFALPWQVSDGASPNGIAFTYPLRDLLKKEILVFSSLITPPLSELVIYKEPSSYISASSKSTTIDDLMAQYFESVEENYPSIVANVVRTSSKLKYPTTDNAAECGLCGLPVARGTDGIHGWGGDQNQESQAMNENHSSILCYGCSRSMDR